jgi:hypothetical protein
MDPNLGALGVAASEAAAVVVVDVAVDAVVAAGLTEFELFAAAENFAAFVGAAAVVVLEVFGAAADFVVSEIRVSAEAAVAV